jgi:hypothetical protein
MCKYADVLMGKCAEGTINSPQRNENGRFAKSRPSLGKRGEKLSNRAS